MAERKEQEPHITIGIDDIKLYSEQQSILRSICDKVKNLTFYQKGLIISGSIATLADSLGITQILDSNYRYNHPKAHITEEENKTNHDWDIAGNVAISIGITATLATTFFAYKVVKENCNNRALQENYTDAIATARIEDNLDVELGK